MSTSATLSLAELKELEQIAAGGRSTMYKPTLISFVQSNDVYQDVMEQYPFSEKKIDSVFNSFNNNLKELKRENPDWPHIELKKADGKVLLINMTALQGAIENAA